MDDGVSAITRRLLLDGMVDQCAFSGIRRNAGKKVARHRRRPGRSDPCQLKLQMALP